MPLESAPEILQSAFKRGHRPGRVGAEGLSRPKEARMHLKYIEVVFLAFALLDGGKDALGPWQPVTARRAPAARFLREEVLKILQHPDGTSAVVEDDHGPGAEPASHPFDGSEIHCDVEMFGREEACRRAARQQALQSVAFAHAARVLLQDLAKA